MNILEREIAAREEKIRKHNENVEKLAQLKNEVVTLEEVVVNTNVDVLLAEIAEIKSYLPQPDVIVEETITPTENC